MTTKRFRNEMIYVLDTPRLMSTRFAVITAVTEKITCSGMYGRVVWYEVTEVSMENVIAGEW
jgi:hypothetical protein